VAHPHMGAKIYKKNDIGKKTGGKMWKWGNEK